MRMSALLCASEGHRARCKRNFFGGGTHILVLSFSSLVRCLLEHIVILFPFVIRLMLCFLARSYFWYELLLPDGTSPSALFRRRRSPRIFPIVRPRFCTSPQPALSRQVKDLEENWTCRFSCAAKTR